MTERDEQTGVGSPPPSLTSPPSPPVPAAGVPPRPNPLPPPRPARPVSRSRKARLVVKRIDPWSVFLYSVVASIFIGIAIVVAIGVLYAVMSKAGVLTSLNELIGDVTSEPGAASTPSEFFSVGKVMTFAGLLAALDVVLVTALATLGAFLYNLCASLTGGIEVTFSDQS
ncbi:MAG: DUF3566 domain-containing protein [Frankiaceae bacterium]|nr:DUF3566 domain-containing protein [Frankiaceae bacterium]